MLALRGKAMLGEAEKLLDSNVHADLFAGFADRALLEGFEIVELAADDAPAAPPKIKGMCSVASWRPSWPAAMA